MDLSREHPPVPAMASTQKFGNTKNLSIQVDRLGRIGNTHWDLTVDR